MVAIVYRNYNNRIMIDLIVYTTPILLLFYRVVERVKKEREKHPLSFYLLIIITLYNLRG